MQGRLGNGAHLHRIQALLKEPGGRLMPQTTKGQALDAGRPTDPLKKNVASHTGDRIGTHASRHVRRYGPGMPPNTPINAQI